ncbi:rod shape-determining protein RodA [Slackia piriformis]|uniref:Rod shape-determining protein RodA n=1 Tax=Slackia piriformis YIT 12062 TaxID=742818 RepID=K0YKM7_9ACTN|nr:rod shape-determining protein RodA [Slackia piriformis]EJZ84152.1 rod shape-determining protein RodA [Slackia piriformis YIT 12062]MDO5023673.1 rod shape-determining protein RodA [Slackia piriformis]
MPGFNEIDRVRMPEGGTVNSGSPDGATRRKRTFSDRIPKSLLIVAALLVAYGLLVVWSAVQGNETYSFSRQALGVLMGCIVMLMFYQLDYRQLSSYTTVLLVINVVLILSPHLPVIGVESKGAQSWINVGMQLQPGEFAKITVILLDASVLARYGGNLDDPREYMKALGYIAVPFLCIMTQPDLGTGLVYLFIGAVTLVMGGSRLKFLLITLGAFVAAVAAVFAIDELMKSLTGEYKLLKQYQRNRLLVFLDPSADTSGAGYNLNQAMIAIGSGGLFGKGLLNASQSSLGFVPEAPTDFIFCVLAEQFGFVGALLLLGLYIALILSCIRIARNAGDLFGSLIVMGVVAMWLFQILENIGMDIGLMPVTGIPLPFMSYGSSFMMVNFALLGLVGSVYAHR